MEESERTVQQCDISANMEIEDFNTELADFPHILEHIHKLQRQITVQNDDITKLKNELSNYVKQPNKCFAHIQTQTDALIPDEAPLNHKWISQDEDKTKSLVEQVTEAAESAVLQQSGFVHDKTTGLYYHHESGYYYDAKYGLYYNGSTGTYYYYDEDSKSYKFHSQIKREGEKEEDSLQMVKRKTSSKKTSRKGRIKKVKRTIGERENVEPEEGECSESDDSVGTSSNDDLSTSSSDKDNELDKDKDIAKVYPPCMRIIVKETNLSNLKTGSLFIVTYNGGSIGREGNHSVLVPDINISKHHAKLEYNKEKKVYEIVDLGSRNGTILNGKRISAAKQESEPTDITHGSILQLGLTKLLCHIHSGHNTCGHCEPGLVQSDSTTEESSVSLRSKHQSELKRLKSKFGLKQDNTSLASRVALGYQDRAQTRREKVGSSDEHAKTQQSSVDESISKDNMGFKMLSKMGWSEGMSLGKSTEGLIEPITVLQNTNKAGLGASDCVRDTTIDSSTEKKQAIWKKTQQRYNDVTD